MFTTEEIKNAMNHLFELFPVAEVEELLEQNGDVVEALELDLLAKKFRKAASNVYIFTHSSGPEDRGTNTGKCLFDQRAAYIDTFSCEQQRIGGNQISSNHELWLLEDMTFAHICCICTQKMEGEQVTCVTECRTLIGFVRDRDDLFFDAASLFESLDDIALFEDGVTE